MVTDNNRSLIALCHLVRALVLCTAACTLCYANEDNLKYEVVNVMPAVDMDNDNNPIPIVGVLTQELSEVVRKKYPNKNITSYVAGSYVKFVEGSGGRVIPIWIGKEREYYEDIMSKINGILLPGGITSFTDANGYGDASRHIYKIAVEKNDKGIYFPLWGTCLGFQYFFYITANETEARSDCRSWGQALPLEFKDDFRQSRMFRNADADVINILSNYPVTSNFHVYCVTEESVATLNLEKYWRVISVNHDWDGIKYISTIEHKKYPFYGIQFHPEKTLYEFKLHRNITHSTRATRAAQYFANFFASETRQSHQSFSNKTEEEDALIYNYSPTYTALKNLSLVQQYFFEGEGQQSTSNTAGGHHVIRNVFSSIVMSLVTITTIHRLCL